MSTQRGMMDNADHGKMCGCHKCTKSISWSAILVGAFVGLGLSFLLNLFSIAIGLAAYKTTQEGATAFAIGGYLGLVIGAFVSYFFAGWAAGHLGFPHCDRDRGLFYGFTTWVVSGVIAMLLAGHMTNFANYHSNLLANPSATYVVVNADTAPTAANNEMSANATAAASANASGMMTMAFASFFLFLIAALSSIFGAHCAYKCRYKHEHM